MTYEESIYMTVKADCEGLTCRVKNILLYRILGKGD